MPVRDISNGPPGQTDTSDPATEIKPDETMDFDDLYRAEYEPMVKLARLLTGSLAIAEEVVQESFVSLHRKANQPANEILNPGGYLRRIVINNCHSRQRRSATERKKLELIGTGDEVVLPPELDETWRSLELLNPKQRTALVLRFYQDMSVRDIAEVMNVREGTVKSLVHRGIERLRKEMAQ